MNRTEPKRYANLFKTIFENRRRGNSPCPIALLSSLLSGSGSKKTGAKIVLYQGDTRVLLPEVKEHLGTFDFVFIDGGHSIETVASDWNSVKDFMGDKTVVVFDDYYPHLSPGISGMGCREIVGRLDRDLYSMQKLEPIDTFMKGWGTLEIQFVKVTKR